MHPIFVVLAVWFAVLVCALCCMPRSIGGRPALLKSLSRFMGVTRADR